jgi:type I restriction enzyme, S subunit
MVRRFRPDRASEFEETVTFGNATSFSANWPLSSKAAPTNGEAVAMSLFSSVAETKGRFVQYSLLTHEFIAIADGSTFGAKMPRVSWDFMGNMPLVMPPPEEQTAIAAFLDRETAKIDALIAEQERLIALLAEKRQAVHLPGAP